MAMVVAAVGESEGLGSDTGIVVAFDDAGEPEFGGNEDGVVWVVKSEGAVDGLNSSLWTVTKTRYSVRSLIIVLGGGSKKVSQVG